MRKIAYRGSFTGLRLEGDNGDVLDVGATTAAKDSSFRLFVSSDRGLLELDSAEVVLLIEACTNYLAVTHGIPAKRGYV